MYLCYKFKNLNIIGAVIITYITGIIVGNFVLIPFESDAFKNLLIGRTIIPESDALELFQQGVIRHNDLILNQIYSILGILSSIIITLAIPLILFSLNLKKMWEKMKKGIISIAIAILSLIFCIFTGYFLFKNTHPEAWKISGMIAGVFIGGSSSLASITSAFDLTPNLFILIQTFDFIIGGVVLLFLITPARQLLTSILPHLNEDGEHNKTEDSIQPGENPVNLLKIFSSKTILPLIAAFGISLLIVIISYEISMILPTEYQKTTLFLLITSFGIICGSIAKIKWVEKSFKLGIYFILVFCLATSSLVNFRTIFQPEFLYIFLYMITTFFVSIVILIFFSTLFKIETEITFVTISALFLSPVFMPIVATRLKNKEMIVTIFTISLLGIAIGNFLGIIISNLLTIF